MTVAIIADGDFPLTEYPQKLIRSADAVVCCDGALLKYLKFSGGKAPDAIVGDMDTLSEELKAEYRDRIVRYSEQDYDDLAKAVRYVTEKYGSAKSGASADAASGHDGTERTQDDGKALGTIHGETLDTTYGETLDTIHIFGASGGAEDFTIGNYGLLMYFSANCPGVRFDAVSDFTTAFPATDDTEFECGCGRTVSVFSPDPTLRIESTGLEWPLDGVCFDNWWKGIRNRTDSDRVTLKFSHPSMALIIMTN